MIPYLAPWLSHLWGPCRLLGSHLVLIGIGAAMGAALSWTLLWRWRNWLPRDRGKAHTPNGEAARGKPTGAGVLIVLLTLPVLLLVVPWSRPKVGAIACLVGAMVCGFADDRSAEPWGEWRKGLLDLAVAVATAWVLCQGQAVTLWLPLLKGAIVVSPLAYVGFAAALLWIVINATNCSDGVDGLAGSLSLLALFCLGGLLYGVVGHARVAAYLLIPHHPEGAAWAVLVFTAAGSLAGYLWHNAEPSRMLMGDAGSRYLGLLIGIAILVAGNPALVLVVAPVLLLNGGTGLVKLALLRVGRRLGLDTGNPGDATRAAGPVTNQACAIMRVLQRVRFPLHDHCRRNLGWSNAQVLMRFMLIQAFLTPLLLIALIKLR